MLFIFTVISNFSDFLKKDIISNVFGKYE